ncbi:MAG: hypothetical protein ACI8VE_003104, partial [Natrialbaceae archaeon]
MEKGLFPAVRAAKRTPSSHALATHLDEPDPAVGLALEGAVRPAGG